MILNCRVVAVELGSQFTDEQERITVFIEEADTMHNRIRLKNTERYTLGEEFRLDEANPKKLAKQIPADTATRPSPWVDSKPAGYISKGSGA
jgi:hypothetical protein